MPAIRRPGSISISQPRWPTVRRIDLAVVEGERRRLVRAAVGDAEAAAEVEAADGVAVGAERLRQLGDLGEGGLVGGEVGQLAADVHVDADHFDAREPRRLGVDGAGAGEGDAELVLGLAGGDLGVGAGVDVGVDAERDRGGAAERGRDLGERGELGLGLDVELADAVAEGELHLGPGLADAGEDDALAGDAGGAGAAVLALRDHVHAGAERGHQAEDREVGVGLHRVADQVVEAGERLLEDPVVAGEGGGGVDVEGRADRGGDLGERHVLGVELAAAIEEVVHQAAVTRQMALPTSSATSSAPSGPRATPTGRP